MPKGYILERQCRRSTGTPMAASYPAANMLPVHPQRSGQILDLVAAGADHFHRARINGFVGSASSMIGSPGRQISISNRRDSPRLLGKSAPKTASVGAVMGTSWVGLY
jgi:hypothetical protein